MEEQPRFEVIELDKVRVVKNVRTHIGDVSGLMSTISKQGLLHPIGVYEQLDGSYVLRYGHRRVEACRKLGWAKIPAMIVKKEYDESDKDFILENFSENKNRSDTSPIEDGKVFSELGLPVSEIANETGMSAKYVKEAIQVFQKTPKEYADDIGVRTMGGKYKNEIPIIDMKKANMISRTANEIDLTKEEVNELFEWAKTHSSKNLRQVMTIIGRATNTRGKNRMLMDEVLERSSEIKAHNLSITISKKEAEKLIKQYDMSISDIMVKRLKSDKIPPLGDLIIGKK